MNHFHVVMLVVMLVQIVVDLGVRFRSDRQEQFLPLEGGRGGTAMPWPTSKGACNSRSKFQLADGMEGGSVYKPTIYMGTFPWPVGACS